MNHLKLKSMDRELWICLLLTSFSLLSVSLYLQFYQGLKPCVLCIYERCALLGICIAGIVGMLAPKSPLRYLAFIIWLVSAAKGISFTWQNIVIQVGTPYYKVCDLYVNFPTWLPLNKWFPQIFKSTGSCLDKQATFLMLDTSQWLIIFFVTITSFWIIFFTSQFVSKKNSFL